MMNNKRVLICYWGRKGGGAQYSLEIAKEFMTMDPDNTYLSFAKQSDIIDDIKGLSSQSLHMTAYKNIFDFLIRSLFLPFLIARLIIYIKKNKIDSVYTTMIHPWTIFFIFFFKLFRIEHILTVHDASIHPGDNQIFNLINKILFNKADLLIVLSNFVKYELIDNFNIIEQRIFTSKLGVFNYDRMKFSPKNFKENGPLRIIFFGRILEYKGLQHLIKAMIILEKKDLNVKLEIYGSGEISKYEEELKKVKNLKLENRWIKDNEIFKIFDKPCLNVLPYIEASQSGIVPIALSCGIPSLVTDFGALKEQIQNEITGIVIGDKDIVLNLAVEIEKLYLNRSLCTTMSFSAFEYAQKNLLWNRICKDIKTKIDTL